jgi:nitrogen regulatory protein PII 2
LGHGKQKGLRYKAGADREEVRITFLPKSMLTIFLNDDELDKALAAIVEVNKTGEIGDGKIFLCPLEETVRIRTDEKAYAALS